MNPIPPDVGRKYWAELHSWSDRFRAEVQASGSDCGCGVFAVDAARALHDLVNHKLGKKVMYPETFLELANWYHGVAQSMRGAHQANLYPWPEGMFEDEDEDEDDGLEKRGKSMARQFMSLPGVRDGVSEAVGLLEDAETFLRDQGYTAEANVISHVHSELADLSFNLRQLAAHPKRPRLSQSFLDTILHTAVGAATALAVTKALTPTPTDIKEGDKPQPASPAVPSVLSPAHVEGDQANVDLGTLLEEIDAILKKPETMGIVDADTLTILRE